MIHPLAFKQYLEIFYLKLAVVLLLCAFSNNAFAQYQQLSNNSKISVLTIEPGTNLYDAFGHNAYRVQDNGLDIIFNYGVYDFNTPNFYTKFAQGKLNYKLAVNYFEDSKNYYIQQNRTIKEQVLNLNQQQKQTVFNFLMNNYEPENQYYLYDFFYNNCATKIKDVLVESLNETVIFNSPNDFKQLTFRKLIQDKLNWNTWGSVGIDTALGSVIDKEATPEEHMFLPQYIHTFFDSATFNNEINLVQSEHLIFKKVEVIQSNHLITSPFFVFFVLAIIIISITFWDYKNTKQSRWLDVILFTITGSIGMVILLLWLATNHSATANNYNLLWAFVINLIMVPQLLKQSPKGWFIKYLKFLVIILIVLSLHWMIGIQQFAFALIPFLVALFIRYVYLINHYRTHH